MNDKPRTSDNESRLIPLGVISGAHGVRGQVKIRSFTAAPEDITSYGPLTDRHGRIYEVTLTGGTPDALIAGIKGVTSRDEADKLRNTELCVPRSALPAPAAGEYYHEDLIGLSITTQDGAPFGTVTGVHNFGAGDIVAVRMASGGEEFLPFNKATFSTIDPARGLLVVNPPEASES